MKDNSMELDVKLLAYDDLIERYLTGQMGEEEETAFLERMKSDEELRTRAVVQARLAKGMNDEIADALKQVDEATIRRIAAKVSRMGRGKDLGESASITPLHMETSHNTYHRGSFGSMFALAASLLLFMFLGIRTYDYFDTTSLGKNFAGEVPFSVSEGVRGEEEESVKNELATLFANVSDGKDLGQTTTRLAELWEESKQNTKNDYTTYSPYIGWYLAIGYLEDNEKDKAKNILWEMEGVYPKDNPIGEKVRRLLREL